MSPIDDSEDRPVRPTPDESERVGYGQPPKQHRFKKGVSGNPRGRRKGVKNEATMLREILQRKIWIQVNGKRRMVPVMQAMLLRFVDAGLQGDTKAATFLLNRNAATRSDHKDDTEYVTVHRGMSDSEAAEAYAKSLRDRPRAVKKHM